MPFDPARIQGLCFDVDGTISDTDDAWVDRITRWIAPLHGLIQPRQARRFARWLVMFTESPMNAIYHWLDRHSLDDNIARLLNRLTHMRQGKKNHFWLMRAC